MSRTRVGWLGTFFSLSIQCIVKAYVFTQLWSVSVEGHPSGYPYGFVVCAIVCGFATLATIFIK